MFGKLMDSATERMNDITSSIASARSPSEPERLSGMLSVFSLWVKFQLVAQIPYSKTKNGYILRPVEPFAKCRWCQSVMRKMP
jgi:hypothetical protein